MNRWDERYGHDRYYYGEEPNRHVARALDGLPPGRGLFLAEGEGRNAVYAADLGHDVVAIDSSREGRRKARRLAERRGVAIDYVLADVAAYPWDDETWDFVVLCFFQMVAAERRAFHRRVAGALRSGGHLILQAFSKRQYGRDSGGPPDRDLLYELDDLKMDFAPLRWLVAREHEVQLAEGVGHRGLAAVIEMIGVREDGVSRRHR
jgi:ubiquinone/menaquinone biosynthesis C-methylase UbiE